MGTNEEVDVTKTDNLCKDNTEPETDGTNPKQEDEQTLGGPNFVPQLYLQRYSKVAQMIEEFDVKKVCVKTLTLTFIITNRQQSCEKVMFTVVCVCQFTVEGGSLMSPLPMMH